MTQYTTDTTDPPAVSDHDLRWALAAIDTIDRAGLLRDCLESAVAAARKHRDLTLGQSLALPELSDRLTRLFGVARDRADRIAREHLASSRRAAVIDVLRRYLGLAESEAERQRAHDRRTASVDEPLVGDDRERAIAAERRRRETIARRAG